MKLTRRNWMVAAGAVPFQLQAMAALAGEAAAPAPTPLPGAQRGNRASPAVVIDAPPTLPDRASFPGVTAQGAYLNGSSTHPRPLGATAIVNSYLDGLKGDPQGFRMDQNRVRANFAKLINADTDEIVFMPSTSIAEFFVAQGLGLPEKGAHVVSDVLHFVGSQYMYDAMSKQGVDVTWIKMTKDNRINYDDFDKAIVKGKTRLVAVSGVSFVTGYRHDLKKVCEIAHAKGVPVFADVIQMVGTQPFDVKETGIDFCSTATYKWLMGGMGTSFLYLKKSAFAKLHRPFYHWEQLADLPTTHMYPFDEPSNEILDYTYATDATSFFQMGVNYNSPATASLEYSLPYIMAIGPDKIQAHTKVLVDRLKTELPKKGYPLLTPIDNNAVIVSFAVKDAEKLAPALNAAKVRVTTRWNHIRMAPSIFNNMEDIERLIAALPKNT